MFSRPNQSPLMTHAEAARVWCLAAEHSCCERMCIPEGAEGERWQSAAATPAAAAPPGVLHTGARAGSAVAAAVTGGGALQMTIAHRHPAIARLLQRVQRATGPAMRFAGNNPLNRARIDRICVANTAWWLKGHFCKTKHGNRRLHGHRWSAAHPSGLLLQKRLKLV